jgi:signal transduction histidine kinase
MKPADDARDLDELLEFFRLGPKDLQRLERVGPDFEAASERLVEEFYQHLLRFEPTQKLLGEAAVRERLRGVQRDYLMSLTKPVIDTDYVAERVTIGEVHERVGLETRWYLGAYSLYFSLLQPVIQARKDLSEAERSRTLAALTKRLLLDAEIAISQYIDRRERELYALNQALTQASQALTREVDETSQDLRRTRIRARAAEQLASVATLVTGLAHEIGTPMGVLRGHAEALEGAVEGERANWRLRMIIEQLDRITSIMQSLLNIARPHEAMKVLIELGEVVETAGAFLADKFSRREIVFRFELSGDCRVQGDPEKFQQVFLNLFLNAVDAIGRGGTLHVRLEGDPKEGVQVRVVDDGTGMSPETLAEIFAPFYTTKEAGHGSGLGLMVVKGIIEEHGGRIEVESAPGDGTEFAIWLPAYLAVAQDDASAQAEPRGRD